MKDKKELKFNPIRSLIVGSGSARDARRKFERKMKRFYRTEARLARKDFREKCI